jgi:hypothetical protein
MHFQAEPLGQERPQHELTAVRESRSSLGLLKFADGLGLDVESI